MAPIIFWEQPRQYLRWAIRAKPAVFWSFVVGGLGPVILFTVPTIREKLGDPPRPQVPLTYPIPRGPRQTPEGYDD